VIRKKKNPIALAALLTLFAAAALFGVQAFGKYALSRMLARDARATAELWANASLGASPETAAAAVAAGRVDASDRSLAIARIDRLVLVPANGEPSAVALGAADAVGDLLRATGVAHEAEVFGLESGAYTADSVHWFATRPYRSWVLFPPGPEGGPRLAARLDQTRTAAGLTMSFVREGIFSGGVAAVSFLAFMAGFSHRERRLAAENAAIRHLALHDQLTGLPNRKHFEELMAEALAAAAKGRHKCALYVLDLDGFKAVNDTLGHPVGDGLLKATARRLKTSLRVGDVLARLSGDEFAIVVPKVTDPTVLAPLAERVLKLVSSPFHVDGHEIQVGCSIGLAVAPDNGADLATLMRNADFALYRAKSEGRRTWRFFDPQMAEDLANRQTLEDGLRQALEDDHFQLLYQPQIELATGRTVGYEAMLRWRLPGRGLVPASVFMSIADETGLVVPIGEWVVRQVARDCALIAPDRRIAMNLSATQLKRDGIVAFIEETMKSHKLLPGRLEIEVNDGVLGRNEGQVLTRLQQIQRLGVGIVMDSFGLGTLSLGLLSRYSFDKIKIDRSFVAGDEQKSGAMLAAICSLGRSLGFRVAGQGVETVEHAQLLRAAGCTEAQGYYFAPPMPLEQLLRLEQERQEEQKPRRLAAIA
jgi:diguanylate cyclase (GGDEF)-like protein